MIMPLCSRLLCGIVIALQLGGQVFKQARATEPGHVPPTLAPPPPFLNEKDLLPYKQKGRSTVAGQAFLGSPSGKAITQAGALIHLIPVTPYTRHWFDQTVRTTSCSATGTPASAESTASINAPAISGAGKPPTSADCAREALTRLQTEKRLVPYFRTTRANPSGHFWFTKIPAGRYYIISLIEGGSGAHQDERLAGLVWLVIDLDPGEKAANLVVTECKASLC